MLTLFCFKKLLLLVNDNIKNYFNALKDFLFTFLFFSMQKNNQIIHLTRIKRMHIRLFNIIQFNFNLLVIII